MKQFHVISVSIGTGLLLCLLTAFVVVGAALAIIDVHTETTPSRFRPQTGAMGELEKKINDLQYGPVNLEATREVKNGRLLNRIRANRQSSGCNSPVSQQNVCGSQATVCEPRTQSVRIVDPSDCNYSHGVEMPASPPINPLEVNSQKDCTSCKHSAKNAIKSGSFLCSNCRKSHVGEWHTEWNDDGTPVTFLCKTCHAFMTPEQRAKSFNAYQARQFSKNGLTVLLHQELVQ